MADPSKAPNVVTNNPAPVTPVYNNPAPPVKKGGFGFGKCLLVGCGLLAVCCICTIIFAVVAPNLLLKTITGGTKAPDPSLTRITSTNEYNTLEAKVNSDLQNTSNLDPVTGLTKVQLSEKEALAFVYSLFQPSSSDPTAVPIADADLNKIGIKFTPNTLKIEIDLGILKYFMTSPSSSSSQNFDAKAFDGINISITMETSADGKKLVLKDFSTGNTVIDNLITGDYKRQILEGVQTSLEDSFAQEKTSSPIEKMTINSGSIEILFAESTN